MAPVLNIDITCSTLFTSLKRFFQIVFAPWPSTYEPIKSLLNAPTTAEKDVLTATWRDRKLSELSFVGITCGLVASVISASFSWQPVDQIPWPTAGLWYGALLMNLTSICLATQQGVSLNRLSGYSDSLLRIRNLLGSQTAQYAHVIVVPHWDQLYVWQTPIMLLNVSVILFITGIVILLFDSLGSFNWTDRAVKIVVLFSVAGAFSGLNYLTCSFMLYRRTV
ncbi:hypothetical protein B0H63DRAFT_466188 [Podospora didyma]|uniref:Uncharacterized protein n=1 Tax=Podospora didyma TaxID=330526 RepID=A0AAE0NZS5_9PEZI|nr:hypothetical protein B0H63DRAFT_466188 [Podospora didyma]